MPIDIPESGRLPEPPAEGQLPPDDGIDHPRGACLYPAGCTGCGGPNEPTLEQILDEARELQLRQPAVICHPDLESAVGPALPDGFNLLLNPHVPVGEVYVLPGGMTIAPAPPMVVEPMTAADILSFGDLEQSDEKRAARFLPPS